MNKRDQFVNRLIKDYPETKVMWLDQLGKKRWSSEKVLKDLNEGEREQFNLRKQMPNEIILDLEEKYKLTELLKVIDEKKYSYEVWDTGSRGFHISLKFTNLADKDLVLRNRIRKYIINLYSCDEQLAKESQWIALEHTHHFKTRKVKSLDRAINNLMLNIVDKEIIEYCENDLQEREKRKIENKTVLKDYEKTDPYFNYVLTHTIENGDRNNILFKNFAIGLVQSGLTREQIGEWAKKIIINCPGKVIGEFMGWVDKALIREITEYNKDELRKWSIQYGYPMLYPIEEGEDISDLMSIKKLWDEIWNYNIECQPIWRDLCFYNMIGTILDERDEDLRVHVIFSSYTSSGKDEGVNLVQRVLDSLQFKTRRPNTVTDKTLVGAVNQSKIEFNTRHNLSEDNPEIKGKVFQEPVELGWLSKDNWIAFSEAEFVFKPGIYNRNLQSILRQAMDKQRRVEKGVGGYDVCLVTNTSFILTTYTMNDIINSILHNGLFQRSLFYNRDITKKEHKKIRKHITQHKFNTEIRNHSRESLYFQKLLNKLREMKKWYDENKKKIQYEKDADKLVENLWDAVEKDYEFLNEEDEKILDSMVRRMDINLDKLITLYAAWNTTTHISMTNIKDCFKLILSCIDSIKGMVMKQDKDKKRRYAILQIISNMSISKMQLHFEIENKLKVKNRTKQSQLIKQIIDAQYANVFQDGNKDMVSITEKGRDYLAYEE